MTMIDVRENLKRIHDRIESACARAGRSAGEVRLVAVSKRIPIERVVEACRAGHFLFGENRVRDALARRDELPPLLTAAGIDPAPVRWRFIGNIQSNKARKVVGAFSLLEAVDSTVLAERLGRIAVEMGVVQPVLLEINAAAEPQKHGLAPEATVEAVCAAAEIPGLEVRGLMAMARFGADEAELHATFARVRELAAEARRVSGRPLPELSMGMSGDFEIAVAEGATTVRIGTAIFGKRD